MACIFIMESVMFRFLYILISPTDSQRAGGCSDTGRAMGTAFSDRLSFRILRNTKIEESLQTAKSCIE